MVQLVSPLSKLEGVKSANSTLAHMRFSTTADGAECPGVGLRLCSFAALPYLPGCLAAGSQRKHGALFDTGTKEERDELV